MAGEQGLGRIRGREPRTVGRGSMWLAALAICGTLLTVGAVLSAIDLRQTIWQVRTLSTTGIRGQSLAGELQFEAQESRRRFLYTMTTQDRAQQLTYIDRVRGADQRVSMLAAQMLLLHLPAAQEAGVRDFGAKWQQYLDERDDCIALVLQGRSTDALRLEAQQAGQQFETAMGSIGAVKHGLDQEGAARGRDIEHMLARMGAELALLLLSCGVMALVLYFYDTQRRKALQAAQQSEAQWRRLFDEATDMVYTRDMDGRFTSINRSGERVTGYQREQLIGQPMEQLLTASSKRLAGELQRALLEQQPATAYQLDIVRHDGQVVPLELSASLLLENGKPAGVLGIGRDVSARLRVEASLRRAKDEAELASKAKSRFLAVMSHELRTPLNGILGLTELALREELSDEVREYLTLAHASGRTLLELIGEVLDFSKIEAGRLELVPAPLQLRRLLEETVAALRPQSDRKGIPLIANCDPQLPDWVVGDSMRVSQILINFLSNSIKFTDRGSIQVALRRAGFTESTVRVRIEVLDTGIGIAAQHQATLFQPFEQGDGSTTRRYAGTGLGLAICKQLAELMGGSVGCTSEPGHGSLFWAELRLGVAAAEKIETTPVPAMSMG